MKYDDETLMAYADGELDAEHRAAIERDVAVDPELARRVEKHRALRAEVSGAFASVLTQPIPDKLATAARGRAVASAASSIQPRGKVLQFPARGARAPGASWRAPQWFAIAASLLLGVLISWRAFAPKEESLMVASRGAMVARGALAVALDRQLASTQGSDAAVQVSLTFRTRDGAYCRSFTLRSTNTAGLACRAGNEWQVPLTTSAATRGGETRQAASETPPEVLAAIQARISGDPLDAKGEEAARAGGWLGKP